MRTSHVAAAVAIPTIFLGLSAFERAWTMAASLAPGAPPPLPLDRPFVEHVLLSVMHGVPGLLLLVLGPVQLSATLRARRPALHCWSGRLFVLSATSAAVTGLVMNTIFPVVGGSLKVAVVIVMGVSTLAAVDLGVRANRRRDVQAH
jgi:uncharacterized membrane protein